MVSPLRFFIAAFVVLAGALAVHAWYYLPFVADEAFVSLRYAARFANGRGLTWTDAERVEGYTNLLWVLLNGVVGKIVGYVPSARALGFAGVLVALFSVGLEPHRRGVSSPRLLVGGVLLVATAPIAIAAIGGLEQGLVAWLLVLSLRLLERSARAVPGSRPWAAGLVLALITLSHADGVFLAMALLAGAACLPRPSLASLVRIARTAIPSAVALFLQFAFRLAYYGKWLPSEPPPREGFAYAAHGYSSASMLVLLAIVATVFAVRRGERFGLVPAWAVVAVSTLVIAVTGGDASPGFRELVPALVALCVVVADEVAAEWSKVLSQRLFVLPVLGLATFLHAAQSRDTDDNRRAKTELREWDDLAVGLTLKTAFAAKRPILAAERPFGLPFGSEFESLDLTGWQTPSVAAERRELRPPPDLLALKERTKPEVAAARQFFRSAAFKERYQWIRVEGSDEAEVEDVDGSPEDIWVLREGGALGVVREPDRIVVPGYFFSGESRVKTRLDSTGALVARLSHRRPGVIPELSVPAGRFRVDVLPDTPVLAVDVRCDGVSMQRAASPSERVFELDRQTMVSIALAPDAKQRRFGLRSVTLTRVRDAVAPAKCPKRHQPLRLPLALLDRDLPESVNWAHPMNFLFGSSGVVIDLGTRAGVAGIELSLTHNDAYLLELRRDGEVVWTTTVDRRSEESSLLNNRFDLKTPIDGGAFVLVVKPRRGNTASSIGHVAIR